MVGRRARRSGGIVERGDRDSDTGPVLRDRALRASGSLARLDLVNQCSARPCKQLSRYRHGSSHETLKLTAVGAVVRELERKSSAASRLNACGRSSGSAQCDRVVLCALIV